ncbi:NAD(P)-dependent oxidoreductase [Natrinema versiforme]|uniref:NAD(P)-dependent oxidoreductase n=1 Tax=Natrinema versiforme TaxID=88724 RepID=A0A4V1G0D5_9EURY|nr:NAD(P)-dependent oxidoreductase [Natrinema versiforme]QCS44966.1 NAD(P)-dependent oxidoreductase [Natrinema versiforme]
MSKQNVLVTGPYGEAGEAILEHLVEKDKYEFTLLDMQDHPDYETVVADIADYDEIRPAFDGQDAVIHLAAQSDAGAEFEEVIEPNIVGTYNVIQAMEDAGVEKLIFASSMRVMGLYEEDHSPELFEEDYPSEYDPLRLDHKDLPKPDSYYGATKVFAENIARSAVRRDGPLSQAFGLRISSVRTKEYDHPYGDAERGVDRSREHELGSEDEVWDQSQTGSWERGSDEYQEMVKRMHASWTSQRDFAHMLECCLENDSVTFDVFYAVSNNKARWFDLEHAKAVIDYDPKDDASEWEGPPNVDEEANTPNQ